MRLAVSILMLGATLSPGAPPAGHPFSSPQALATTGLPQADPAAVGVSAAALANIGPAMQRYVDAGRVAGIVTMVARRGRLVHQEAVGAREIASGDPLEVDDIFRIYSMTKPVTAVAVMILVEEGKIGLDDPVSRHLPAFADVQVYADGDRVPPRRPMTIRDLLRHTSGLAYGPPIGQTPVDELYAQAGIFSGTLADFTSTVASLPLVDHPGARWNYSVSSDLLGALVEVVAGQPFDEFLAERIFAPLDMVDTGFFVPAAKWPRFAALYASGPDGSLREIAPRLGTRYDAQPSLPSGGGGLVSTAADYVRFAQLLLNGGELDGVRLLRPETVEMMRTNQLDDELIPIGFGPQRIAGYGFGLGLSVLVDEDATPVPDNDGLFRWMGIASTYFWVDPEAELVGLLLTQLYPLSQPMIIGEFQTLAYQALED